MKPPIHRNDSDVRQHHLVIKNSTQILHPKIVYTGELKQGENFSEQKHFHDFCEILFVRSGSGFLHLENKDLPIQKGDIVIYNPNVQHYETGDSCLSFYFFGISKFKLEHLQENYFLEDGLSPVIHSMNDEPLFEFYFSQLIAETQKKLYYYDEVSDNLVNVILCMLLRLLTYSDQNYFKTNESYLNIKNYIDEHYLEIKSIDNLCSEIYVSRFYLSHLFKEYSGISPSRYILVKKVDYAKQLLITTDLSISIIAERLGYIEVNSFVKAFKSIVQLTPYAFRCKNKRK